MARVLVIGYGNPMRSDDGLGWQVAVDLLRTNTAPDVEILPCHQLTPELIEAISNAETVLFIDCAKGDQPGQLRCVPVCSLPEPVPLTHDLTPAALLALGSELYGVCPRAFLLSIQGANFAVGDKLSSLVNSSVAELKSMVWKLVDECLSPAESLP
jgi:hydrogenase maturation protease